MHCAVDFPSATGIWLDGNDHYLTNVIVFSSHVGVMVSGNANIITGVHTWNLATVNNGTGIYVTASQTRLQV